MAQQKLKKDDEENRDVSINLKESSVAEFTKRPLPSQEQVEQFEKVIEENTPNDNFTDTNDEMEEEIEESLNEIYQDDKGHMVNVKKLDVKGRRGFVFWIMTFVIVFAIIGATGFIAYNYYILSSGSDATAIEFSIKSETEVTAGEEFFYTITYDNLSNVVITNARVEVHYPDNFIYLDSFPETKSENNNIWEIPSIPAKMSNSIKIKGMLVGAEGETAVVLSNIIYTPANFSSEFKKEDAHTTILKDIGLEIDIDYISTALMGEDNDVYINFHGKENNYITNFRVAMEPQENIEILEAAADDQENTAIYSSELPGVWQVEEVPADDRVLPIKFRFTEKIADKQTIKLIFSKSINDDSYSPFYEAELEFEVMKSDLNLTLIINGSRDDQGIDFGDTLNYSIVYNNKGETELKDVIIMAVLESNFLDGASLVDELDGREKGNTITWSKEELPELEVIEIHEEGTIDFSIQVAEAAKIDQSHDYQVSSYVQFSVGDTLEAGEEVNEDNRSNIIINKINSDLKLIETLRYFSEDNIPVGTGPHPPKVGETTTYKVYWDLKNNLHELNDLQVTVVLPDYATWNEKERATVGTVSYNDSLNAVIWEIGRLPITVFQANAEFSISITPGEDDRNKIMVLLPGSKINAIDAETEAELMKTTSAKTSKLEDDDIARGDGIVE